MAGPLKETSPGTAGAEAREAGRAQAETIA